MTEIFVDLDGVLADFDTGVRILTGRTPEAYQRQHGPASFWTLLARTPQFYTTLPPHPDGPSIWVAIRQFKPTILSGVPHGTWAAPQKRAWVDKYLGPHVPLITCMSHEKADYAHPGDILIDDRAKTGPAWEAAGGRFIHHVTRASTLTQIAGALAQSRLTSG